MSELKFRGWATSGSVGGFVYFDMREDNDFAFYEFCSSCEADNIEQYTGLKDKNGKEIYEGDIVKGSWLCGKDKHIVKYEDYGFYPFTVTDFNGDPMIRNVDIEVIGNIHENPELLEDKK